MVWRAQAILWVYIFVAYLELQLKFSTFVDLVHEIHENLNPTEIINHACICIVYLFIYLFIIGLQYNTQLDIQ